MSTDMQHIKHNLALLVFSEKNFIHIGFYFTLGDLYVGSHQFLLELSLSKKTDDDEIS